MNKVNIFLNYINYNIWGSSSQLNSIFDIKSKNVLKKKIRDSRSEAALELNKIRLLGLIEEKLYSKISNWDTGNHHLVLKGINFKSILDSELLHWKTGARQSSILYKQLFSWVRLINKFSWVYHMFKYFQFSSYWIFDCLTLWSSLFIFSLYFCNLIFYPSIFYLYQHFIFSFLKQQP